MSQPPPQTTLTLGIAAALYRIRIIPCETTAQKCYELRKPDGTKYHVSQHITGPECTCGDYEFRRKNVDPAGCKHVKALVMFGMIEGFCPKTESQP
jgi:hypothetical protein